MEKVRRIDKINIGKDTVDALLEELEDFINTLPPKKQLEFSLQINDFYFNKLWEIFPKEEK